jgi:IS4 transposase
MLVTDRSRTVLLDVTIAKSKSDQMSKPLPAIQLWPMWSWVPMKVAALGT